jgi:hypothetical protein
MLTGCGDYHARGKRIRIPERWFSNSKPSMRRNNSPATWSRIEFTRAGRTLGFPDAEPAHGPRDAGDPDGLVRIVQKSVEPGRMANPEISTDRPATAACPFAALNSHCSCLNAEGASSRSLATRRAGLRGSPATSRLFAGNRVACASLVSISAAVKAWRFP